MLHGILYKQVMQLLISHTYSSPVRWPRPRLPLQCLLFPDFSQIDATIPSLNLSGSHTLGAACPNLPACGCVA